MPAPKRIHNRVRTSLFFPASHVEVGKKVAAHLGIPFAQLVREAVESRLRDELHKMANPEPQPPENPSRARGAEGDDSTGVYQ